jgi:hypothetical protein
MSVGPTTLGPRSFKCPVCKAEPGSYCVWRNGKACGEGIFHNARRDAAAQRQATPVESNFAETEDGFDDLYTADEMREVLQALQVLVGELGPRVVAVSRELSAAYTHARGILDQARSKGLL